MGRLSYALYILHNPLLLWFGGLWKVIARRDLDVMPLLSGPPLLVVVIGGSFLMAVYFDEPIRKLFSK